MYKWTLEKFMKHYGVTLKDIEEAKAKGIHQRGRWLIKYDKENNEITIHRLIDNIKLTE